MAQGPEQAEVSPQMRLLARLRLQRVVFGVLAAVLVTGAALGLAEYRRLQASLREAERAAHDARTDQADSESRLEESDRRHARTREEADALSRALGLNCARLAVQEARAGFTERAGALVQDALRYGAPPWWPVAAAAARENGLRFRGSLHPESPVACGDATPGGAHVAIARNVPGACVVELYDGREGSLLAAGSPALAADRTPPLAEALALAADGKSLLLAAQGRLFLGESVQGGLRFAELPGAGARVQQLSARPDLSAALVARGRDGLFLLQRGTPWSLRPVPTPGGDARAACFGGPGEIWTADAASVYRARGDGPFLPVCALGFEPDSLRLGAAGGGIALCARTSTELEYFIVETPGDRVRDRTRLELPGRADGTLQLLPDGTALTGVGGGRVLELRPGRTLEHSLGAAGPTFAHWHDQGLLFGNGHGDLGLRPLQGGPGRALAALAPQMHARAQPFGFITSSPDGDRAAWLPGTGLLPLPAASRVRLAGYRVALTVGEATSWLDRDGVTTGMLLGAGQDGLLLWREGARLVVVDPSGATRNLACASSSPPDDVEVAAGFSAAVMRWQDSLFITDLRSDPRPLARAPGSATDMLALSADGGHLAMLSGSAATVRDLAGGAERTLMVGESARACALLYGGSVLAVAEPAALALYEVAGGRELLRLAGTVDSMAATPGNALLLVSSGVLRVVEFPNG